MRRAFVVLFAMFTLVACASRSSNASDPGTPTKTAVPSVPAASAFVMQRGETVRLPDGATLKYVAVTQDSRCPPDVQCIRAGDADLLFEFATGGGAITQIKPNLPEAPSKTMGAWHLTVKALEFGDAAPVTVRIDPAS